MKQNTKRWATEKEDELYIKYSDTVYYSAYAVLWEMHYRSDETRKWISMGIEAADHAPVRSSIIWVFRRSPSVANCQLRKKLLFLIESIMNILPIIVLLFFLLPVLGKK